MLNPVRCPRLRTTSGLPADPLTSGWLQEMPWLPDLDVPDTCEPSDLSGTFPSHQKVSTWGKYGWAGDGAPSQLSLYESRRR